MFGSCSIVIGPNPGTLTLKIPLTSKRGVNHRPKGWKNMEKLWFSMVFIPPPKKKLGFR